MKVGDYVRTKYGITQFKEYETTYGEKLLCMPVKDGSQVIFANIEDCVKSSPNIIDLIEVGDYVNGSYIYSVVEENKNTGQPRVLFTEEDGVLGDGDIKSIVTKEQFSSMKYKLGE